jgi:excisionase family DNA binding protein
MKTSQSQPRPCETTEAPATIPGDLIGYSAAAALLGVPVGTLYSWTHLKKVPHIRLGPRLVRFSRAGLAMWLRNLTVEPGPSECGTRGPERQESRDVA